MKKTLEQIKKQISQGSWYKQGIVVIPLYVSYPHKACWNLTLNSKDILIHYDDLVTVIRNNYFDVFLSKENLKEVAD